MNGRRQGGVRMTARSRRTGRCWALAALLIGGPACAWAGSEPSPFPVEPAQLAKAETLHTLPCPTGSADRASAASDGFTTEPGLEPVWRVAGTIVAVRRAGADRFAFVLESSQPSSETCVVQQVVVLPRRGSVMQCQLPDSSSTGIGVHTQSASGRRDTVYWEADPKGRLHRLPLDALGIEADTGNLVCSLP